MCLRRLLFTLLIILSLTICRLPGHALGAGAEGEKEMPGLVFSLGEGTAPPPPPAAAAPRVMGEPLPEERVRSILERLPAPQAGVGEAEEFAFPPETLPPPRPGRTVEEPFPPQAVLEAPAGPEAGPLEILRHAPDGEVPLAPKVSLTFSQPMVELTALEDLAAREAPVRLTPQPEGRWRWVGTKTLVFEPVVRLPMATRFEAEVPAGTAGASGGRLEKAYHWTFSTPPPQVTWAWPKDEPAGLTPLVFVVFDQRIDPAKVLGAVTVTAAGRKWPVRLADQDEADREKPRGFPAGEAAQGRWLAFRPVEPLPPAAPVTVEVGPGAPSAEGPLTTTKPQSFSFSTYTPLEVTEVACGWGDECPPLIPWTVRFNNELDQEAFDPSLVKVEPELEDQSAWVSYDSLTIKGLSRGRTEYRITLGAGLKDVFGQTLGRDRTVTVKVGASPPGVLVPAGDMTVLDPGGRPAHLVYTINYERLKVKVYKVRPEDFPAYRDYYINRSDSRFAGRLPGRLIHTETVRIKAEPDQLTLTALDLTPWLEGGLGHLVIEVQPELGLFKRFFTDHTDQAPVYLTWVQATQLGLDAFGDYEDLVVWTNLLANGAPLSGVEVSLHPGGPQAATGPDGLARLPLPGQAAPTLLIARRGRDEALLLRNEYWYSEEAWRRGAALDGLRWYVFDDRGIYRPGEEVYFKGWVRRLGGGKGGDVGPLPGSVRRLTYHLFDSQGNELATDRVSLNALGGFDFSFKLPEGCNLGEAALMLEAEGNLEGAQHHHYFQVQEFRRPEFEVSAEAAEGPHLVGGEAYTTVTARYYAGGPLPGAEVTWRVTARPGHFQPPGWDGFTFGVWTPWWMDYPSGEDRETTESFTGRTDASGAHRLRLEFKSVHPPQASSLTAEATVMDVNRQAWTAQKHLLVHPTGLYVGLRSTRLFVDPATPFPLEAIVTDLDGRPVPGRAIDFEAVRLDWTWKNGRYEEVEADRLTLAAVSSQQPVTSEFKFEKGGTYRLTAAIKDDQGRGNRTILTVWVSGGPLPRAKAVEQEQVQLIPDRREYRPGETAEILVQAPFHPAEGLVTYRRSGLVHTERFRLDGPSYTLKVPLEEAHVPNLHVQVDLVGAAGRTDAAGRPLEGAPPRPAYAAGALNLSVSPLSRTLALEVKPREEKLEPGAETEVELVLKDHQGAPVAGGEVALVVVDEAVLALTGYEMADPVGLFYSDRSPEVGDWHSRRNIVLADPSELMEALSQALEEEARGVAKAVMFEAGAMPPPAPGAAKADGGDEGRPIAVRADFRALAVFAPELPTDREGRARVKIKMPDSLTRYRVMAVAVAGGRQFGKGEAAITARLPLMVRPSPPRFLRFGDRMELPVVVQNQTGRPLEAEVALRVFNLELEGGAGRRVSIPADDRIEVRFPVLTLNAGRAGFQAAAVSGSWADAAENSFPVWTPATTEAVAVYGELDEGAAAQPVLPPENVYTQFGGLTVTTSSTALQALTDAYLYLVAYPFECSEQLASRILSVAALKDVLAAFHAEGLPSADEVRDRVQKDIERLASLQNYDGGFPLWVRGRESWPYHSLHAAHALWRAREMGFEVPEGTLEGCRSYLSEIENNFPAYYGERLRYALTAYALYVRARMGEKPAAAEARRLYRKAGLDRLSLEAVGWLLYVLSDDPGATREAEEMRRHLINRAEETAGTANFVTSYGEEQYLLLHSDRRTDAVVLEALIKDQPQSDLIPKVVRGLMAHRRQGRWDNTQENVFILLALERYFKTFEAQSPDFVARFWLGDRYAGAAAFKGRTADYRRLTIPMAVLAEGGRRDLVLSKEGPGRLYYRLGLRYAPRDLSLGSADNGFTVERTYEAVDQPEDVKKDEEGAWRIKAGARVRVRLALVAPSRRYHVALTDSLPAGFEPLNPVLAVTGALPPGEDEEEKRRGPYWWWWGPWYEHENLRDERVEAFASLLWDGVYDYTYIARATTPGRFIAGPAKAEEMYAPETFGRSRTETVVIE
ncbi:MAG: alpha-2-macroglobulin family protein [Thermodesulfobacteriota bacterium]